MFAPLVLAIRQAMGDPDFLKLRGQAIALHSKVITNVCNRFGIEHSQRQAMIRLTRDNGKRLGLLV